MRAAHTLRIALMVKNIQQRRYFRIAIRAGIVPGLVAIAWIGAYAIGIESAPQYPRLNDDQKNAMEDALYQFKGHYVRIAACDTVDCQKLARDLGDVFDAAGWEHLPDRKAAPSARGVTVSGPWKDRALLSVIDQLNQVLPAPVVPPSRDDGGATEIVIGTHPDDGKRFAH